MFFKKFKNKNKIQLEYMKFLFSIQNKLLKFNWELMDDYKKTKDVTLIESMNLIQDSINSLNKAQLNTSKQEFHKNVVDINNNLNRKTK